MKVIEVSLGYLTPYLKKEEDGGFGGVQAVIFPGLCSPMAVRLWTSLLTPVLYMSPAVSLPPIPKEITSPPGA